MNTTSRKPVLSATTCYPPSDTLLNFYPVLLGARWRPYCLPDAQLPLTSISWEQSRAACNLYLTWSEAHSISHLGTSLPCPSRRQSITIQYAISDIGRHGTARSIRTRKVMTPSLDRHFASYRVSCPWIGMEPDIRAITDTGGDHPAGSPARSRSLRVLIQPE